MTRQSNLIRHTTIAITALAMLFALGACGRKGNLEPPPGISPNVATSDRSGCPPDSADTPKPVDAVPGGAQSGNPDRLSHGDLSPC
jgi:predicted small lipoprotein YifL